jgi:predicted HicB family RNase H-like nuclease
MARETKIRIPEALHTVLTEEADRRGVSLNALANIVLTEWVDSIARLREALDEARKNDGS